MTFPGKNDTKEVDDLAAPELVQHPDFLDRLSHRLRDLASLLHPLHRHVASEFALVHPAVDNAKAKLAGLRLTDDVVAVGLRSPFRHHLDPVLMNISEDP